MNPSEYERRLTAYENETDELRLRLKAMEEEMVSLRRRLADTPRRVHTLETRLTEAKGRLEQAVAQNEKLSYTLAEARDHIASLRDEIDKLTTAPSGYGTYLGSNPDDGTVDVFTNGRKMRVQVGPAVDDSLLVSGAEVVLNDSLNITRISGQERSGEVMALKEILDGNDRAIVMGRSDEERVVDLASWLRGSSLRSGDHVLVDLTSSMVIEKLDRPEVNHLVLEEVPDVSYSDIGGLAEQIEQIVDAVELPFVHAKVFAEYDLPAPKGILLYGPPGCGKTLIAKAVANSLAKKVAEVSGDQSARSYFLNIKGPELLNKYVGETERQIRLIFERAREKSEEGWPVIIFFDEMESLFRMRGSGISSDMESTIVPQLLAEIDGVESLKNTIVIGASNREDLIDPAILRPGRLDVKIKIERPGPEAARSIFSRYVTADLPLDEDSLGDYDHRDDAIASMIDETVEFMYRTEDDTRFLEVTYANGDSEVLYFRDFSSGAMIENIVRRAKKLAIKRLLDTGDGGIRTSDLLESVTQEFSEQEDLPNTTNPDDWAKISGKKGQRITFVRTLVSNSKDSASGGRSIERVTTGQYL